MKQQRCPCCGNHCNVEKLKCKKGKRYFAKEGEDRLTERDEDEEVLSDGQKLSHDSKKLLRKFAKGVRHGEIEELLDNLTEDEKQTLFSLLKKCIK